MSVKPTGVSGADCCADPRGSERGRVLGTRVFLSEPRSSEGVAKSSQAAAPGQKEKKEKERGRSSWTNHFRLRGIC